MHRMCKDNIFWQESWKSHWESTWRKWYRAPISIIRTNGFLDANNNYRFTSFNHQTLSLNHYLKLSCLCVSSHSYVIFIFILYPIFIHVLDAQGQEDIVALNEFLACKDCISAGKGQRGPILQQSFIHLLTFSFRIIYLKEEFVLAKFGTDWRNNGFYSWGENVTESLCHLRFESKRHNTWLKTPSLPTFLKK